MPDLAENPRAVIGDNQAPAEPTPFELSRDEIEGLWMEATNFLDGEPITTQPLADAVGELMDKLRQAEKRADERRKAEAKPHDEAKAEIQARYNPLIQDKKGKAALAIATCKAALKPFLDAQEAEKRAIAEKARQEAEAKQKAAQEAFRAAQHDDLVKRAEAERLLMEAAKAQRAANKAENDKASVKGGARAISARPRWVAALADRREAARFMWTECPEEFDALLTKLGQDFVNAGRRTLPGFVISEERSVQ